MEGDMDQTYLSCAETAKLIRTALKRAFPGFKFSVRSETYAGGASIDVTWTDGPTNALVDPVIKQFCGGRFDGMIDMAYSVSHWLLPDGTTVIASNPGTHGQMGTDPGERNEKPHPDAKLVHFGANHIFGHRNHSEAFLRRVIERAPLTEAQRAGLEIRTWQSGNAYVHTIDNEAQTLVHRTGYRFMIASAP